MNCLLRLVSHPKNNKHHIDKMIALENVPENLFFNIKNDKRFLKDFVEVDIVENVPQYIRDDFSSDEKIYKYIPPAEKGMAGFDQEFSLVGLVLDFQNRNGAETWLTIERMIEAITPRDRKPVEPVVVAVDHRSDFKRDLVIPVVDLKPQGRQEPEPFNAPKKSPGRPKKVPAAV